MDFSCYKSKVNKVSSMLWLYLAALFGFFDAESLFIESYFFKSCEKKGPINIFQNRGG